jgi:hypothetical protein
VDKNRSGAAAESGITADSGNAAKTTASFHDWAYDLQVSAARFHMAKRQRKEGDE